MSHYGSAGSGGSGGSTKFPITPYTVGPSGSAAYQDVASAVTAAGNAGGGLVYIQPGSWTIGTLTIPAGVNFMGAGYWATELVGSLIPPLNSYSQFSFIRLTSSTNIFDTNLVFSGLLTFDNCLFTSLDGYTFNLPNSDGSITLNDCICDPNGDDGFLNNSAGFISISAYNCIIGSNNNHAMDLDNSTFYMFSCQINCIISSNSGLFAYNTIFNEACSLAQSSSTIFTECSLNLSVITSDSATLKIIDSAISTGISAPLELGSSVTPIIINTSIDTTFPSAIVGSGNVVLAGVEFLTTKTIDPLLTVVSSDLFQAGAIKSSSYVSGYRPIVTQSADATFALSDANTWQKCTKASTQTLTVPANASVAFPIGTEIDIWQQGAGPVTFAAAGGVTIQSLSGDLSLSAQFAGASLKKTDTNTWALVGSLSP